MTQIPKLVDLVVEDPRWEEAGLAQWSETAAKATLMGLALPPEGFSISLLGCDDGRITALNDTFRRQASATNVLSWPSEERRTKAPGVAPETPMPGQPGLPLELGDIALAFDTCAREATSGGIPLSDHGCHLVIHGVLHLIGYDHETDQDAALMESLETRILRGLGIADPYARGIGAIAMEHGNG
ncbi:MAG: rRNA maturation RNase YbeY [Pseudomonadota bacterium]